MSIILILSAGLSILHTNDNFKQDSRLHFLELPIHSIHVHYLFLSLETKNHNVIDCQYLSLYSSLNSGVGVKPQLWTNGMDHWTGHCEMPTKEMKYAFK